MTTGELIEKLKEHDPDLPVYIRGYEYGVDDVDRVTEAWFERNAHNAPWAGRHDMDDPEYMDNPEKATRGIFLDTRGIVVERLDDV